MHMRRNAMVLALAVVIAAVVVAGGMPAIDPSIVGTWQFTTASTPVGDLGPLPGQTYRVTFREDGTMTMNLERNEIDGSFTATSGDISIEPQDSSPSWVPGSPGPRLIEIIAQARTYDVTADTLALEALGGRGTLNFDRVD